jgi:hypothetical protein
MRFVKYRISSHYPKGLTLSLPKKAFLIQPKTFVRGTSNINSVLGDRFKGTDGTVGCTGKPYIDPAQSMLILSNLTFWVENPRR